MQFSKKLHHFFIIFFIFSYFLLLGAFFVDKHVENLWIVDKYVEFVRKTSKKPVTALI